MVIRTWTNTKVVFGLGSAYPVQPPGLKSGDTVVPLEAEPPPGRREARVTRIPVRALGGGPGG